MMYGPKKKMINGGMTRSQKSSGGKQAQKMMNGGPARTGYRKGNKVEMHKCMPN